MSQVQGKENEFPGQIYSNDLGFFMQWIFDQYFLSTDFFLFKN